MKQYLSTLILSLISVCVMAQDNTIHDGGEYYLFNTYYGMTLGSNAANDAPTLSKYGTNADSTSYVFVAEASSLHQGYYWLRQKSTGKYLQASNKTGDTWSIWFAGSLNKEYNSYEWRLSEGINGEIISNRGEAINADGNVRVAPDPDKEGNTYINIYYDKPVSKRTEWQIVDARFPLDQSRLKLYTDALDIAISQGEAIYDNPIFGSHEEQYELAVALYNARSARNEASISNTELMETARTALLAAIENTQEGNYDILISGNSFPVGKSFTVALQDVKLKEGTSAMFLIRNTEKTGITYTISQNGSYHMAFDGSSVKVYLDGKLIETVKQTQVQPMTSSGTSAEWSVFGEDNLLSYNPEIRGWHSALKPDEYEKNAHGKAEITSLKLVNTNLTVPAAIDYHILSPSQDKSLILLDDPDAWVFFDNIRPSDADGDCVSAQMKTVRKAIYLHGTVFYQQSPIALYGYKGELYNDSEYCFGQGKAESGEWVNEMQSFILKRGYMVCLATNADGSGYSRVYVADHEDKYIDVLPELLRHRISYVNIRPWNWVSKKGWCSTEGTGAINAEGKLVGATWFYTWSADRSSQTDMEYVPQKGHVYWPSFSSINGQTNATCVLGYNEPEHSEQHSDDCGTTIGAWTATTHAPEFFESGLRIGSPAPTDASWLKEYIGHCNDMAYRVDFVAFHAYWGTNEAPDAASWKNQLQSIYNNTRRPIWLTEWNNGASWTSEWWPSDSGDKYARQMNAIKSILKVLDESDFIERYAIYNWDSWYRACMSWDSNKNSWWVTPCGEVYRDSHPTHAYNEKMQFTPIGWFPSLKTNNSFSFTLKTAGTKLLADITDLNGDCTEKEKIEYLDKNGTWQLLSAVTDRSKFDNTSLRTETISCRDCPIEAFQADSLTLRLKITTIKDEVTVTESCTQPIPAAIRLIVGIDDIQNDNTGSTMTDYDLNGRPTTDSHGKIVIRRGKKIMLK